MFLSLLIVPITRVTALNAWIGPYFETGVWNRFLPNGFEQICVEHKPSVCSTSPTLTTTPITTAMLMETLYGGYVEMEIVMPGEAANCDTWHPVVEGDSCQGIADQYGLTLDEFIEWNWEI